jgi:hypothetical protein
MSDLGMWLCGQSPRLHRKILEDDAMEDETCLGIVYLLTVINTHHKTVNITYINAQKESPT